MQNLKDTIAQFQSKSHLKGLVGSSLSFIIAEVFKEQEQPFLLVFNDKEEAAFYLNDLEQLINTKDVFFYPGSYRRPYQIEETDNANILLRAEVLNRINSRKKPAIIITYPDALFEKVVTRKELNSHTLKVAVNDKISIDFINEVLFEYKFKRVDFVTEPGEFSVRGGIVDVFSFSNDEPYRVEFFGDEIDSIRTFDVETQLSNQVVKKISIIPNVATKVFEETRQSFLKYISANTVVFTKNAEIVFSRIDDFYTKAETTFKSLSAEIKHAEPEALFCNSQLLRLQLNDSTLVEFGSNNHFELTENPIVFKSSPQPAFNKQFNLLIDNLNSNHNKGYTNYITCVSEQQAKRFHDIFEESEQEVHYKTVQLSLHQGFVNEDTKTAVYTDHQIFERYHKFKIKNGYAKKQAITLKELTNLDLGDYVTHIDHGIGRFGGLQKIDVEGNKQEAIKLIYGERDVLYLSIHSLHKITKFNGKDGKPPKVYKLGSKAWKTLKEKTKSRVKHVAFNLIKLYAKRKLEKGYQYNEDSHYQHELEASFIYEDTPDQITATSRY